MKFGIETAGASAMSQDTSITQWIDRLKAGDAAAARKLWELYYGRLVRLAYRKLRGAPKRAADEEDVVQEAFKSFCQGAQEGRFPLLHDRHDLWSLVVRITEHKAYDQLRAAGRKKRGSGKVRGESALDNRRSTDIEAGIGQVPGLEPEPAFAVAAADSVGRLLDMLNERLREVALLKLEGYTNQEIAERIGRAVPTVELRLRMIRATWQEELSP
jgi:RNA polymerase sigma factor (sigma-70 family)